MRGFARRASATLAISLECEGRQQLGCAVGAPNGVGQHAIEVFGEDLTWAIWYIAEPPSTMNSQPSNRPSAFPVLRSQPRAGRGFTTNWKA
jgi:hypothetical protein